MCIPRTMYMNYDGTLAATPKQAMGHEVWDIDWSNIPNTKNYNITKNAIYFAIWIRIEENPKTDPTNPSSFGMSVPVTENNLDKMVGLISDNPHTIQQIRYGNRPGVRYEFGIGNAGGYEYYILNKNVGVFIQVRSENVQAQSIADLDKVISTIHFDE
jgi:hypothetical protein